MGTVVALETAHDDLHIETQAKELSQFQQRLRSLQSTVTAIIASDGK